jgi:SlyX protein
MPQDQDFSEQLYDLQSQLAFQEDTIQALNSVVIEQQQQIGRLNEMINQLKSQMEATVDSEPGHTTNERPPHY